MAPRCLRAREAAYHHAGLPNVCAYCHEPADTIDHTVPSWFVQGNFSLIARSKLFKVPACRDCNSKAGMLVDRTFIDRKRRIALAVHTANRKLLNVAHWPDDEMKDLGHRLRTYIQSGAVKRAIVMQRLLALNSPLVPLDMTNELTFNLTVSCDALATRE